MQNDRERATRASRHREARDILEAFSLGVRHKLDLRFERIVGIDEEEIGFPASKSVRNVVLKLARTCSNVSLIRCRASWLSSESPGSAWPSPLPDPPSDRTENRASLLLVELLEGEHVHRSESLDGASEIAERGEVDRFHSADRKGPGSWCKARNPPWVFVAFSMSRRCASPRGELDGAL